MNTIIDDVRTRTPLIHHLTNQVVMNFTANGLLAFGASPIMAKDKSEAKEIAELADGVLLNIGTIYEQDVTAMKRAGRVANERKIPLVFDPVGVGATRFRRNVAEQLLHTLSFTVIKGNAGEMAHLVDIPWKTRGVESIDRDIDKLVQIAERVARKYKTLAIVTGEIDVLAFEDTVIENKYGHTYLTKITGAGCLLGSIITACLTADARAIDAAYEGIIHYTKAAERAVAKEFVQGTGTFLAAFIDELST